MISGVYTALVSPFDEEHRIDYASLETLIAYNTEHRVHGFVVLGTTGEAPTITSKERTQIIQHCIEKSTLPIIVGCTSNDTQEVITMVQQAEKAKASGVLIATPYYNKPTQEGIYRHFQAISLSTSLPIHLYNHPTRTGQKIELETLRRLIELPHIVSIKEASCDAVILGDTIEEVIHTHKQFSVLAGDDLLFLDLLTLGGQGIISVLSNLIPKQFVLIYEAIEENNLPLARALFYAIRPLIKALCIETNPGPIKYLLHKHNLIQTNTLRLPLCAPAEWNAQRLNLIYDATKHLIEV